VQLGQFFRYARHFDFHRFRWCTNSGQHPNWRSSKQTNLIESGVRFRG
jgi:hypothetical protein